MKRLEKSLVHLDNLCGVSGEEELVLEGLKEELEGFYDEFFTDPLGNGVFVQKGGADRPRIALCAHMDEIGFMVRYIEDNGRLTIVPVGYHDNRMVVNQDLCIHTRDGMIQGVTGCKPNHLLSPEESAKVIPMENLSVDVGTTSREETEALGVRTGDYAHYNRQGYFLNGTKVYTGKSVDNRSGCAVLCEVFRQAKEEGIDLNLYAVGTVQEEVGIRGAGVIGHRLEPDLAIAIDVTIAGNVSGVELTEAPVELGKGAAIKYYDWDPGSAMGNNVPRKLIRALEEVAENQGIPYQREVLMGGGTDGWTMSLSGSGVRTCVISIPEAYMHTAVGTVHLEDMENCVQLILEYLKTL
ncbi:MAG: M42 family metallopeptidase [Tissierellia bacterium]|nr:M42 family metallopeptidase [Tissierellia bacterium]